MSETKSKINILFCCNTSRLARRTAGLAPELGLSGLVGLVCASCGLGSIISPRFGFHWKKHGLPLLPGGRRGRETGDMAAPQEQAALSHVEGWTFGLCMEGLTDI